MIRYISTRGPGRPQSFEHVLLSGMAPDGGLYMPDSWPIIDRQMLSHLSGTAYAEIAFQILRPFIGDGIAPADLQAMVRETYAAPNFTHPAVAPLVQVAPNLWMLELFHGPTLSFKDYALQLLGRLFDHVLGKKGMRLTIIGATSGDTGSAAIEACRHCKYVDIFMMHPKGRVSDVQRRQMTGVDAPNVFNIALDGTFDDCQNAVKAMFADDALRAELNLSAVNSINWARIAAQSVYYVAAAVALNAPARAVSFAVPTGNFGNVFAGWAAGNMGLPVHQLHIATNRNDILARFFETGEMKSEKVVPSLSPSMDIQISSNFERYLCEATGNDHDALRGYMNQFKKTGTYKAPPPLLARARRDFQATRCGDEETIEIMRALYHESGLTIDPHSAVGMKAALAASEKNPDVPVIALACAHPAKFPGAVERATGRAPDQPERLQAVMERKEICTDLPNDLEKIKNFVRTRASAAR